MSAHKKLKDETLQRVRKPPTQSVVAVLNIDDGAAREIVARLARIEGQVRALARMVDERRDCYVIAQQLGAARRALERASAQLMVSSLARCMRTAKNGADELEIQKLTETFIKLL